MSLNSRPKVSIIVPCYNCESFIDDCVGSISHQSYTNIEIILINDGSTDNTGLKLERIQDRDNRVRYCSISNSGPAKARNYGIRQSLGNLIMFVDADDLLLPNAIQSFVDQYLATKADIIFSYSRKFFTNGLEEDDVYVKKILLSAEFRDIEWVKRRMIGLLGDELSFPTKTDSLNTPWAKLYDAAFIREKQIYFKDRAYIGMEDVLFNIECVLNAVKVSSINQCTYSYRQINNYSVSRIDADNLWIKIKNLCAEITKIPSFKPEYNQALINRMFLMSINILLGITNPREPKKTKQRIHEIKSFVEDFAYQEALSKVEHAFLPLPFRILYMACRMEMPFLIYPLAMGMRYLRKSKVKNNGN